MKTERPAILLYFAACILAVLATVISSETLLIFSKPIVIPAIFFYYLSIKTVKFNIWYAVFLALTFIGDTIVLLELRNGTMYIMVPYVLSYVLLLRFILADTVALRFSRSGFAVGIFVFAMIVGTAFTLIGFFDESQKSLEIPILIYGLILALQAGLSAYHINVSNSNASFFMAMTALFNCVSDIFYVIFMLIVPTPEFLPLDIALQLFSYYFVIKYFVYRKN
ncbi:lysoplasmalogenase family protein [Flavobacterium selenitireducens]|uniref:lysoplasmalogenase family protein n=1 Tax=Flavobacterium selenitireducens TaxID=2722704 RepID=UPI00168A63C5|nr:lysoplasmalogenase family protein [Flavobacterium selenitireducens]MBD3582942.1 hypothetical protein [Flavobacterium selenitireducens]